MPKRRHSSLTFAPGCIASVTNSLRKDMVDTACQGTVFLQKRGDRAAYKMCYLCLRTGVTHVPGLYSDSGGGSGRGQTLLRDVHLLQHAAHDLELLFVLSERRRAVRIRVDP